MRGLIKALRHLFRWIEDPIIFQVREGNKKYWLTREEWFKEQKLNPNQSLRICSAEKGNSYAN